MTGLVDDLRLAARRLARAPGFTAAAVTTLAIGIGAVAGVGALLYGLLWRPLPAVRAADVQLVVPVVERQAVDPDDAALSWRELEALRAAAGIGGAEGAIERNLTLTGDGEPERVLGASVTPGFLGLLGVAPLHGRDFAADEGRTFGHEQVALVAHALWRTRYGADPALVGRTIEINQRPVEVVGVLPPGFGLPDRQLVYLPFAPGAGDDPARPMLWTLVRPAGALAAAEERVAGLFAAFPVPAGGEPRAARLLPLRRALADAEHLTGLLGGVVAAVLLLCCTNVANLLIARAAGRETELAVRAALGAGRSGLVRQTLAESLLLAAAGTVAGALYGRAWLSIAIASLGEEMPPWLSFDYDARLAVGGALLAVGTALGCGLWPALRASGARLQPSLAAAGRGGDRAAARRAQRALVVAQFAFALALLAAGTWMTRSFLALNGARVGFEPERLLTARLYLPGDAYDEVAARARFHRELIERIGALPGVEAVATTGSVPVDDGGADARVATETSSLALEETLPVSVVWAQPELFRTLGVDLPAGELFAAEEGAREDAPSALVNRALADALWPGLDPLGRRLRYGTEADSPLLTVTGVVPDLVYEELTEQTPRSRLQLFVPYGRLPWRTAALLVRTAGDPAAAAGAVRAAIAAVEPDAPVYDVLAFPARLARTFEERRLLAELVGLFAAQGLLLAAVGVFGVLAYAVAQRRRELGIRAALGAAPRALAAEIAGDGLRLALLGAGAGLLLALCGGALLRGTMYGVDPLDPAPLVATTLLLGFVALLACLGPARRAARLEPSRVLRDE